MLDSLNRCSIGIRIPESLQTQLVEVQTNIRRRAGGDLVRWTPPAELMLTLVALGEISAPQVYQVQSVIGPAIAQFSPIEFTFEGVGGQPSNLQPRFIWIGLGGDTASLERMEQALGHAIGPLIRDHDSKGFRAYVPIGRLKQETEATRSALGRAIRMADVGLIGTHTASQVELVRAASTSMGPTLVTIQAYPLS